MILFFLIAVLSFLVQLLLPWWSMAFVAFGSAYLLGKRSLQVFFAGFFGCGIIWLLMAFYIHFTNGDLMTNRMSDLFSASSPALLYAGTFLIAAITGGLAAWAGFFFKEIFKPRKLKTGTW